MRNISESLISKWYREVWNEGNRDAIDSMLDEYVETHGLAGGSLKGIDAFKKSYDDLRKELHDIFISVDDVLAQDDMESCRCTVTAVHTNTGKPLKFTGQNMVRISNGKIVEAWNSFDFLQMYTQAGYNLGL